MELSKNMYSMLNKQINAEMYSAYLYQAMAAWLDARDLPNMARWMGAQAKEELEHAFKIYGYLQERGEMPRLMAIDAPETEWTDPCALFAEAQKHEQQVSEMLRAILKTARAEEDYPTESLMVWFVNEQVEEESNAAANMHLLALAKDDAALHQVDKEFAARS